ncbi:thermonuclease family protein [Puniceicoccaceae bacterium K14]|nr:thermonuclease family protein [Puniceicoccaceae bacterium K14]
MNEKRVHSRPLVFTLNADLAMLVFILLFVGALAFAFIFLNKKSETHDREGVVNSILSKDALSVDFGNGKNAVVKFFGISVAHESEMQDEKIDEFLQGSILGSRFKFKPQEVANGDVILAEVYTLADEYVNAIFVRQGLARWVPSQASNDSELLKAQEEAKSKQAGVWNLAIQELMKGKDQQSGAEESSDSES